MDRREFIKTCSFVLVGAMLPKSVLGETKDTVKENFEKAFSTKECIESLPTETFTKKISEMKGTPLEMKGIYAKDSLKQFLGLNQYEEIFEKYNKETVKYRKNGKINDDKKSYIEDELNIPRIYDELREYFPEDLGELGIRYPGTIEYIGLDKTLVIITKVGNGRFALAYYKDGMLFLATHISPGKISPKKNKKKTNKRTGEVKTIKVPAGEHSPEGTFKLVKSDYFKYKKSRKFELSPMPYAIQIHQGVFLHHGQDVNGYKKSHGCIRVPGFYQEDLYKNIKTGTKIIIDSTKD